MDLSVASWLVALVALVSLICSFAFLVGGVSELLLLRSERLLELGGSRGFLPGPGVAERAVHGAHGGRGRKRGDGDGPGGGGP